MPKKFHVKPDSLGMQILKGVAITGVILIAATNPLFGPKVLQEFIRRSMRKDKRATQKSLRYLRDRGYVNLKWLSNGQLEATITKQGKKITEQLAIDDLKIASLLSWDAVWRLVIFDVPNTHSKNRSAFTQHLKNLGFRMIQKSVWIHPYRCHREVMILRKFYQIEPFVTYLETKMVEDDEQWREYFNL